MKGLGMDEAWNRWMRRFKRLLCTPMWKEWPADDPVNPRPASTNVAKVFLSDFSGIFFKIYICRCWDPSYSPNCPTWKGMKV